MGKAIRDMVAEMNSAGYLEEASSFVWAMKVNSTWFFICVNEEEGYTAGTFHEATATRSGDFGAAPIAESDMLNEVVDAILVAVEKEGWHAYSNCA